ncbi:MAG: bifunctional [glutamate--ammonia ligase]-adenylyl-L-tyrosine phosphorylase/[glutamate--ammonia-ligase] adenylyltransferase [Nevskia sp.]|nr:bifunctional [glutamate--ammonia ligase]-adenylyl-L-tyrosine phosphorylase/[glutamate--ammonia-ligase] adenylyltransferase [Nevskia sp.]
MEDLLQELRSAATPASAAVLPRLLGASPFVAGVLRRQREWARAALAAGDFERPAAPAVQRLAEFLPGDDDEAAFLRALRVFRNREMARIACRDVAGWADLDETLGDLSALAQASCDAALRFAAGRLAQRWGVPRGEDGAPAQPIVLGMGKLGGGELNFSSDIDLIFVYTGGGATDGAHSVDNAEYFVKLAQQTARLLAERTEDGFVFRVDTMLRPFGSAGAPSLPADAMEAYYQTHGRDWERYALIKARPVAGDLAAGAALLRRLQPFVYRRYLDFGAIDALRQLKVLIDRDAARRGAEDDLKLGPGGIRELEFVVQLFQLVRGGRDARLRDCRLRPVLRHLGQAGHLPAQTVRELDDAYVLLRRCENAVQMYEDAQTHRLPPPGPAREALCLALGADGWDVLAQRIAQARARVAAEFARLFTGPAQEPQQPGAAPPPETWQGDAAELEGRLRGLGFVQRPQEIAQAVEQLGKSVIVRALPDPARARLHATLGRLAADARAQDDPETTLARALRVLAAIAGRSTYLSLLIESAGARRRLLELCGASPWITGLLAQSPGLLDTLLDARLSQEAPDRAALRDELAMQAGGVAADDPEASMELLRRYRQEMTLRIAAADLSGALPLVQVSDRLTWLAEAIVGQTLVFAQAQQAAALGVPPAAARAQFAVLAYGKFGSIEMGYGSDLDLVFVYDAADADAPTEGGARRLPTSEYFVRLAQRVVQLLSARTTSGRAYEVDLELRPSGNSGLVVTSLAGFARYQRESAWTWEHQALLRARPVAGDAPLCAALAAVRAEVLGRPRQAQALRKEVADMRVRMRSGRELHQPGRWDVKQACGGLVDAEFLTQYLCLLHAHGRPALIEFTDNWRQLEALAAAGILEPARKEALLAAERSYRGWLHRRALQAQDGLAEDAEFTAQRAAVSALWDQFMGGG